MVKYLIYFFIFLFQYNFVLAYGIGISPDRIQFSSNESRLYIFNSNNNDVQYQITGCENQELVFNRTGIVYSGSKASVIINLAESAISNLSDCNLDITISDQSFSIGFSVPVMFNVIANNQINQKQVLQKSKITGNVILDMLPNKNSKILLYGLLTLAMLVLLFIIWKFL